jgi:hypothetical protein
LNVSEYAATKKCDWRVAAMAIAIERIGRAPARFGLAKPPFARHPAEPSGSSNE